MNAGILVKSINLLINDAKKLTISNCVYDSYNFEIWYDKVEILLSKLPNGLSEYHQKCNDISFKNTYQKDDINYDAKMKRLYNKGINKIIKILESLEYNVTLDYDEYSKIYEIEAEANQSEELKNSIIEDVAVSKNEEDKEIKKYEKIFISHASKDKEYVDLFFKLLKGIGLRDEIFYSSKDAYGVPLGAKIFDYLKNELDKSVHVVYMISNNYYDSPACLNEMGATWVKSIDTTTVLLPAFSFTDLDGAIDPRVLGMKMDNKSRLGELKDKLINMFNLKGLKADDWEEIREEYLNNVKALFERDRDKNKQCDVKVERIKRCGNEEFLLELRFINRGVKAVEFTRIDIELIDEENRLCEFSMGYNELEYYKVREGENKIKSFKVKLDLQEYNPDMHKDDKCKAYWQNA